MPTAMGQSFVMTLYLRSTEILANYRVIIKYCTIVVGIGGLVEGAASLIT
jgi:hypothetical protein